MELHHRRLIGPYGRSIHHLAASFKTYCQGITGTGKPCAQPIARHRWAAGARLCVHHMAQDISLATAAEPQPRRHHRRRPPSPRPARSQQQPQPGADSASEGDDVAADRPGSHPLKVGSQPQAAAPIARTSTPFARRSPPPPPPPPSPPPTPPSPPPPPPPPPPPRRGAAIPCTVTNPPKQRLPPPTSSLPCAFIRLSRYCHQSRSTAKGCPPTLAASTAPTSSPPRSTTAASPRYGSAISPLTRSRDPDTAACKQPSRPLGQSPSRSAHPPGPAPPTTTSSPRQGVMPGAYPSLSEPASPPASSVANRPAIPPPVLGQSFGSAFSSIAAFSPLRSREEPSLHQAALFTEQIAKRFTADANAARGSDPLRSYPLTSPLPPPHSPTRPPDPPFPASPSISCPPWEPSLPASPPFPSRPWKNSPTAPVSPIPLASTPAATVDNRPSWSPPMREQLIDPGESSSGNRRIASKTSSWATVSPRAYWTGGTLSTGGAPPTVPPLPPPPAQLAGSSEPPPTLPARAPDPFPTWRKTAKRTEASRGVSHPGIQVATGDAFTRQDLLSPTISHSPQEASRMPLPAFSPFLHDGLLSGCPPAPAPTSPLRQQHHHHDAFQPFLATLPEHDDGPIAAASPATVIVTSSPALLHSPSPVRHVLSPAAAAPIIAPDEPHQRHDHITIPTPPPRPISPPSPPFPAPPPQQQCTAYTRAGHRCSRPAAAAAATTTAAAEAKREPPLCYQHQNSGGGSRARCEAYTRAGTRCSRAAVAVAEDGYHHDDGDGVGRRRLCRQHGGGGEEKEEHGDQDAAADAGQKHEEAGLEAGMGANEPQVVVGERLARDAQGRDFGQSALADAQVESVRWLSQQAITRARREG
ncbi:hypothetical protein B0J12DRAFT_771129 [Macrophomina phaseolina]|uniref:Uncharacterized protein n=1 Tax=Macrophomina phaseolina TaxID=35725 RepID=A0ABQ8FU50_9PEZI|nr:hypothetical protein B0J12DRAFT_771129 [Macrophomina phaseolina]